MATVCFYFQVHQPFRLRDYTVFEKDNDYFDEIKNKDICRKVANKCYLPANRTILKLIDKHGGNFKVSYSITGTLLEQFDKYCPEVMSTFHALANTGCVEFIGETYYHSLSFLYSKDEFKEQVSKHSDIIERLFGKRPTTFRNTELIYNNELSSTIEEMQCFDAVITEGADRILNGRSPNFLYRPPNCERVKLFLKNYSLSDDIAFRFSNRAWPEYPLMTDKFADWINAVNGGGNVVNLFMDYETFGEHQWADTGIFEFLSDLPEKILANPDNNFMTPAEATHAYDTIDTVDVPHVISWADTERDLSAWLGNAMQSSALHGLYKLERTIKKEVNAHLVDDWRKLQTSDHFYYMCTKFFQDGDVHKYFNPYDSPYDSYINFMNVLSNRMQHSKVSQFANWIG